MPESERDSSPQWRKLPSLSFSFGLSHFKTMIRQVLSLSARARTWSCRARGWRHQRRGCNIIALSRNTDTLRRKWCSAGATRGSAINLSLPQALILQSIYVWSSGLSESVPSNYYWVARTITYGANLPSLLIYNSVLKQEINSNFLIQKKFTMLMLGLFAGWKVRHELARFLWERNPDTVWPNWAKFRHFGNILKVLDDYVKAYLVLDKIMNLLWCTFYAIRQIFIVANCPILTNNLAIWSHCPDIA